MKSATCLSSSSPGVHSSISHGTSMKVKWLRCWNYILRITEFDQFLLLLLGLAGFSCWYWANCSSVGTPTSCREQDSQTLEPSMPPIPSSGHSIGLYHSLQFGSTTASHRDKCVQHENLWDTKRIVICMVKSYLPHSLWLTAHLFIAYVCPLLFYQQHGICHRMLQNLKGGTWSAGVESRHKSQGM